MTNTSKIAIGFAVGTLLGATLGLLFAPKKGSQTRAIIGDKARDVAEKVNRKYAQARDVLGVNKMHQDEVMV
ncbi:MAG: YtxH domain-containing protein [Cytophagales bacterium]|nr:YtxH domain-containing protein [Cytophagales bacterium]